MGIWRFTQSLKEAAEETTSTIRWLLGVVLMLAAIGVAFGEWISTLNTIQIISFYVGIGIIALIGFTFLRGRKVIKIRLFSLFLIITIILLTACTQ